MPPPNSKGTDAYSKAIADLVEQDIAQESLYNAANRRLTELTARQATLSPNTDAYKNIGKQIEKAQDGMATARANQAAIKNKINEYRVKQEETERLRTEGPQNLTPKDRETWDKEKAERDANEAAGKGWHTGKELEDFETIKAGRNLAQSKEERESKTASAQIRQGDEAIQVRKDELAERRENNAATLQFSKERLELEKALEEKRITVTEYNSKITDAYNRATLVQKELEAQNTAATTLVTADVTMRGQDIQNEQNIRSNAQQNASSFLQFFGSAARYMAPGTRLTWGDLKSMYKEWQGIQDDNVQIQAGRSREANPRGSSGRATLEESANAGVKPKDMEAAYGQFSPTSKREGGPAAQPEPGAKTDNPVEAAAHVREMYQQWVATQTGGKGGTWEEFEAWDQARDNPVTVEGMQVPESMKDLVARRGLSSDQPQPWQEDTTPRQPVGQFTPSATQPQPGQFTPPRAEQLPESIRNTPNSQQYIVPRVDQQPGQTPQIQTPSLWEQPKEPQGAPVAPITINVGTGQFNPGPETPQTYQNPMGQPNFGPEYPKQPQPPMNPQDDPDFHVATSEATAQVLEQAGFDPEVINRFRKPREQWGQFTSALFG